LLAIYDISDLNLNGFSNFRRAKLGFSVYVLIISISVLAMVAFNSLAVGFTTNILLLLFVYNWRVFEKTNEKQL
jgi:hypothetical protein